MKRQIRKPAPEPSTDRDAEALPTDDELDTADDLHETEAELGISEWIDPDTGAPAEDSVPRLEDH